MKVLNVVFERCGEILQYLTDQEDIKINDFCLVKYEKGKEIARVVKIEDFNDEFKKKSLKYIIKKADDSDIERMHTLQKEAREAVKTCIEKVQKHELHMKLIGARYNFNKSKLTFYFFSSKRVDFRKLVRDLAYVFKTRIELLQVGVRDEAKRVGGIGCCGLEVCCSKFLYDFSSVSIKMAKRQDINLNPMKISGLCGRLLCCLSYENEFYKKQKKKFPDRGKRLEIENRQVTVANTNYIKETVTLNFNDEFIKEVTLEEYNKMVEDNKK